MKKNIYYGNIVSHVAIPLTTRPLSEVSNNTLTFTGFNFFEIGNLYDLIAISNLEAKLDLLYYNRVNEIGEVLSSLVYISPPLSIEDVSDKVYNVKKLYTNTEIERTMGLSFSKTDYTYLNCKWGSSKFFTNSISPLVDTRHTELASNGIPSVKMEKYGVAFDGWYTQMSVGVRTISVGNPPTSPVAKGLVGYHTFSDIGKQLSILLVDAPSSIDADVNWSPYTQALEDGTTNYDGTVLKEGTSLAKLLVTLSEDNPYVKQDIFILPTYMSLYNNAVVQYAEYPTYGNPYPILRDKHRILHNYASDNNFIEAQYVLQSTDYFRAITQR